MFRIGDFSRIARVSARLLRFYDEIGLFGPAHADSQTGYRYYTADQLTPLNRILVLKELGFNLDQVRDIVKSGVKPEELRNMLLLRKNDVAKALAEQAQRLRHIETRIDQLESDGRLSADDVIVRAEPAHRFLSLRRVVPSFDAAVGMIGELAAHARDVLPRACPRTLAAIAHSPQFEADEVDVEFGYMLAPEVACDPPAGGALRLRELEAVSQMAVCVRVGLPQDAHLATAHIGRFVQATGRRLDGPSREVFLRLPAADRMHEAVIEMQFPVSG